MAAEGTVSKVVALMVLLYTAYPAGGEQAARTWCVVRSEASDQALQGALDYACAAGADCAPLQSSGLCYLPNTVQAHASYAFNSYYQRKGHAPGSCSFAGTATIAKTDPSYGSCVYPSSPSTAGSAVASGGTTGSGATPTITEPPPTPVTGGVSDPGLGPTVPNSLPNASPVFSHVTFFPIFSFIFQAMWSVQRTLANVRQM